MKKSRFKILFINLLTVAVILGIVEIASRVILHKIYNRDIDQGMIIDSQYLSSSGKRKMWETKVWGKDFTTDEAGRRRVKGYRPGKKQWLYIGDSVTEGVGVDDSSTFASMCSERFEEFNLCNYSLIGYSTTDYVNVLKTVLPEDSNVELVTVFYCLNDVYGDTKTKDLPVMAKQNVIGKLNSLLQNRLASYKLLKLLFYKNSNRYFTYDLQFYKQDDPHFSRAMSDLHTCDSICKAQNVYFNVVVLPYQSQLKGKNFTPQQMVKAFCDKDSIDFSDPSEYLSKQPDINSLYLFADEIHFSEKGHRAIAGFLSE